MTIRLEKAFAKFAKAKHAVAVNSARAALHLTLWAAGVKTNDEVIVLSFSFVANAEAIALLSAEHEIYV